MPLYRLEDGAGLMPALFGVQRQTVLHFTDTAARAEQLPAPWTGALTFLEDALRFEWWDGSSWVAFGQDAALAGRVAALEGRMGQAEATNTVQAGDIAALQGRVGALEGRAARAMTTGAAAYNTDGIGQTTVAHGLGVSPAAVLTTPANQVLTGGAILDIIAVDNVTATTFRARCASSHGDQILNGAASFYWAAIAPAALELEELQDA